MDKKKYEQYLREIINFYPNAMYLYIGIIPLDEYEKILPGINRRIKMYNEISKKRFSGENLYFIYNKDFNDNMVMSDYHHPNKAGHMFIFNKIVQQLNEITF